VEQQPERVIFAEDLRPLLHLFHPIGAFGGQFSALQRLIVRSLQVSVSIYVSIRMSMCLYVCVCVYMYVYVYVSICICICVYMYVCIDR
jgi:hypothetical protein